MASVSNYEEEKAQMEKHLQFVAREIGCDWRKLGRELKIGHAVIQGIVADYMTEEERAYQVLVKWSQDKGFSGATKDILIKALKDIGKTSIAELIEHKNENTGHQKPPQQLMIDVSPHDEPHTSTEERRKPPSPTCNHIIEKFDKTLKEMYQSCRDNLTPSTDCPTLVNKLKLAQHVKDLNEILKDMIESNGYISGDGVELLKKSCRTRLQHTDQIVQLILQTLTCRGQPNPKKASQRKGRRLYGMILPQRSSEVELQPRSNTFSNGISSLYKCNQIYEEEVPGTEEATESFPPCHCCGSCLNFEAERCASENQKISLEENCSEPLQQTSSIKSEEPNKSSVTRSSSSPFPTPNSFKFEELTKELGKMLKYCQDSLPSCHRPELGHILKFLEYIQALNEMMLDATDSRTPKKDDEPEIAEMKKAHRARHRETDQTIVLTEHVLTDRMHKSRPVSQILRRCTSTMILPQSRQMCEIVPRCTSIIQLRKASQRKGRPVSEILPQCSSEVELQTAESIPVQDEINADNLADAIQDSKL